jgi:hypothetical protein
MEYFSAPNSGGTEDVVLLVCMCCQTSEVVRPKEPKLSDFEVAHGVLLYCSQCQAMTRWKQRFGGDTRRGGQSSVQKSK